MNGQKSSWKVVGIYNMAGTVIPPMLFANKEPLSRTLNQAGRIVDLRVVTSQHDAATQRSAADQMKQLFEANGIKVTNINTGVENMAQQSSQINLLIYTLLVMAVLIALVGGLGLMGTMSMNTLERTREIGVMRSIGAADQSILEMVIVEGMVIGLISWIIGMVLSFPITVSLNYIIGVAFVNVPMRFMLAPDGYLIWLIMVLVISAVSSLLPARKATRLTVRDVLAYE
jgi:putative ABC transport system permease protein